MSNLNPTHTVDTVYPFYWVSPVRVYAENDDGTECMEICEEEVADYFGVYRYDLPGEDGISEAHWLADFPDRNTADFFCYAANSMPDTVRQQGGAVVMFTRRELLMAAPVKVENALVEASEEIISELRVESVNLIVRGIPS